jgi:hypothetical protein
VPGDDSTDKHDGSGGSCSPSAGSGGSPVAMEVADSDGAQCTAGDTRGRPLSDRHSLVKSNVQIKASTQEVGGGV